MSIQCILQFPSPRGFMLIPRRGYALIPRKQHRLRVFPGEHGQLGDGRHAGTMESALHRFEMRRIVDYKAVWKFRTLWKVIMDIELDEWLTV